MDSVSILGMLEGVLKGQTVQYFQHPRGGFNPWYVGGGVKSPDPHALPSHTPRVSILGMLEGVLKASRTTTRSSPLQQFQSLVCWRGC